MTAAFSKLKSHFLNWREWELNPVVVKELRQSVRSWAVTGMLLLFLTVLFCTALIFLISQSFELSVNQRLGGEIFQIFTAILTGASLLFIPLYVGIRLAAERQDSNLDLLYITTLTPARIIRGKFFCGAYMAVLFFSACMPFMAFTNLLRGVDLPTVAFILLCLFLVVCVAIQAAIFVACLPMSKLFKVLVGLIGLVSMFFSTVSLTLGFISMMRSGVGSMMGGSTFWTRALTVAGVVLAAVLLLHLLSIALISPQSANRALPLRSYLTGVWVISAGFSINWALRMREARLILPWTIITLLVMAVALVIVISNQDQLSLRVRRMIPERPLSRALAFLFYNGAAGGLVWVFLVVTMTIVGAMATLTWLPVWKPGTSSLNPLDYDSFAIQIPATVLYVSAYALTALFIHRKFLARRSSRLAGVFAILLPAIWALIPNVVLFFTNRLSFHAMEATQLGNVFNIYLVKDYTQWFAHLICAGLWLLLTVFLNARWFVRQMRDFRRLEKFTVPEPIPAPLPPPIPTQTSVPSA